MRAAARCVVLTAAIALSAWPVRAAPPPWSDGFETAAPGWPPASWLVPPMLRDQGVRAEVVAEWPGAGTRCAKLLSRGEAEVGNLMRSIDATPYRGQLVRLSALVRVDRAGGDGRLWLRVDRDGGVPGFFGNMGDRPVRDDTWRRYEIVGPVADDAVALSFGLLVAGRGTAWIDDVELVAVGPADAGIEGPASIDERGMINLIALARLLGDLRHFHPSDAAANADWSDVAVRAVRAVEDARDDVELAGRLRSVLEPLAPMMTLALGDAPPDAAPNEPPHAAVPPDSTALLRWEHHGYGQGRGIQSIYRSERVERSLGAVPGAVATRDASVRRLTAGPPALWSRVPLVVATDGKATRPEAAGVDELARRWPHPDGWRPSPDDRATRLASVILAWNVLQHFYPYFDVVPGDWDAALPGALAGAATAPDGHAWTVTLERLVAALHDGHGRVAPDAGGPWVLPLAVGWADDDPPGEPVLVVLAAATAPVRPGDVIVSIDDRPTAELWRELAARISGATEGWKRHRVAQDIMRRRTRDRTVVELRRPDGTAYTLLAEPVAAGAAPAPPRPDPIAELEPGIWYVDLDRIDDAAFAAALPDLAGAEGLVLDLRGYPRVSTIVLAHLTDEPIRCAQWHVPVLLRPDRAGITFDRSGWDVQPQAPRLTKRVAFLTDGRAISYAETTLGIVEAYGLAEIVGAPTAGTNGNVTSIALPTGHTIVFTGMRVLKHDGSRHHGVGIRPTVPVTPTVAGVAAGRDEVLERGIEAVRQKEKH